MQQELDMDMPTDYLSPAADMRSQQMARLMRDLQPRTAVDDMNRLERSVQ
jgi:hypothetical protein